MITCANVSDFLLSNFSEKAAVQLFLFRDFTSKVAVDSDQACLICATKNASTFTKVDKTMLLKQKWQRFLSCANYL